ncbi:MAG: hypothetical protein BGO98_41440 [Myxococcales bacterium 68-20]|nr:MAG: hypothetical protein BGO98_41440 [Myxococcales bacterium 68-20]
MVQAMKEPAAAINGHTRDLVTLVLLEAVGSSVTSFVPVPFVDDYLLAQLLRRITRKVSDRAGQRIEEPFANAIVDGYVRAADHGLGEKAFNAAARFLLRKVALVLDVKRSHDVFGQSIAYALALDIALKAEPFDAWRAPLVGRAIHRATESVGSAAIELISRAGRDALNASSRAPEGARLARVAEAIGKEVDSAHGRLEHLMRYELARRASAR